MQIEANYNPDVLTCLANLSNDEVFTPPGLANQILDLLPAELWKDKTATFLDPACKSGVFLREIAKRLIEGLREEIPDLQARLDHIYTKQLYGIAITELTALLSRRSVYCSKKANGKYSVCSHFSDDTGNIRYVSTFHSWESGRCSFCGASEKGYERGSEFESHAYQFVHTINPQEIFNMKFDVIIGNPPYQLSTAGEDNGAQAKPLYHLFVDQAKKMKPNFLAMIIPSRWFAGGWGLDEFRERMINDNHIKYLHDFPNASDCFPGVEIKGGVCYFLWEKNYTGNVCFLTHSGNEVVSSSDRPLKEKNCDIVIRYNDAIPILHKIRARNEPTFDSIVSTKKPFGFTTNYSGSKTPFAGAVKLYGNRRIEYVNRGDITRRLDSVDEHKLIVPKAVGTGDSKTDIIKPLYCEPNSCCTETYLLVGPFRSKSECENVLSYVNTKFFHFLVTLQKNTQDCMKKVYSFVPLQDFSSEWTDRKLVKKYGLTNEEISFIDSIVRPMESINV
jgi:hypothetical protein